MTAAVLYMAATPIGNLQDISRRAAAALQQAEVIAAEDTRLARRLLAGLNIPLTAKLLSLRAHNERQAAQAVIHALQNGRRVVYVCDAGTPAVSDPGAILADAVRAAGFAVSPLPGACALTALLSVAGPLAGAAGGGALHFYGFAPAAAAARRRLFQSLRGTGGYSAFYEAPHRIAATLQDLAAALGGGQRVVIGRELTKRHEQIAATTLSAAAAALQAGDIPARGEFALLVQNPAMPPQAEAARRLFELLAGELPPRRAAALAAKFTGAAAGELYKQHITQSGAKNSARRDGQRDERGD